MCGIAGYLVSDRSSRTVDNAALVSMTRALIHRGPDDEGFFWSPQAGLGSRRLSIIDLSPAGRMPIFNETRSVAVVQNGEIYNFASLRADLEKKGHHFVSHSDTEAVVHLYEELGEQCIAKLDGMYAIALWDASRRRLLLARDRFGEKPLYYCLSSGALAFASELKSLVHFPFFEREPDWAALDQFLTLGCILAPNSAFRNAKKLLPGHYLVFDQATAALRIEPYWKPTVFAAPASPATAMPERHYVEALADLILASVRSRLVSDVPVGAFLSGGIDSSLVVKAMAEIMPSSVRTFSIGVASSVRHNENPVAGEVARTLGVKHETMSVDIADILGVLDKLPWLSDEPVSDPALFGVYLISRFARSRGISVMLSGDGGDEVFLGYPAYRWMAQIHSLYRLPRPLRTSVRALLSWAGSVAKSSRLQNAGRCLDFSSLAQAAYYLTGYGSWSWSDLGQLKLAGHAAPDIGPFAGSYAGDSIADPVLCHALALMMTYLPDNNLARMDRASMANSLETRAPLLNPQLLDFSARLPLNMKLRGSVGKYILRHLLASKIPSRIINQPKHGFDAFPMAAWLRKEMKFLLDEHLDPSRLRREGLFNPVLVEAITRQHLSGRCNHWRKLWLLTMVQMWLQHWAGASLSTAVGQPELAVSPRGLTQPLPATP